MLNMHFLYRRATLLEALAFMIDSIIECLKPGSIPPIVSPRYLASLCLFFFAIFLIWRTLYKMLFENYFELRKRKEEKKSLKRKA